MRSALKPCHRTAPGNDDISYQMISHLSECSIEFQEGKMLISWKEAIIIPIAKPGKKANQKIQTFSLTSCICKLLEKMVNFRFAWYLEKVPSPSQFRFRKMRTDALLTLQIA